MSETKEPMLEVEHDVLFETFSRVINIGRPNNLDRVGLGRQLAKVYQFVLMVSSPKEETRFS